MTTLVQMHDTTITEPKNCLSPQIAIKINKKRNKILSELIALIKEKGEVNIEVDLKKFTKLYRYYEIPPSETLREYITTNLKALPFKRTNDVIRYVLQGEEEKALQEIRQNSKDLNFIKIAKYAFKHHYYSIIEALLEETLADVDLLNRIFDIADEEVLTHMHHVKAPLLKTMIIHFVYWGKVSQLSKVLKIKKKLNWLSLKLDIGEIIETHLRLQGKKATGDLVKLMCAYRYNPFRGGKSYSSLTNYVILSKNKELIGFFIEEVIIHRKPDEMMTFFYELSRKGLENVLNIELLEIIQEKLKLATYTVEQLCSLYPLMLPKMYPLNAYRIDLKDFEIDEAFKGLISKIERNIHCAYTLSDLLFLKNKISLEEKNKAVFVKNVFTRLLAKFSEENITRARIQEALKKINELFESRESAINSMYSYCKRSFLKSDHKIHQMHGILLFGPAKDLRELYLNAKEAFDVNEKGIFGEHSIFDVVREGKKDHLIAWLEYGGNPNLINDRGESLLGIACYRWNAEIVDALLEAGAQITSNYVLEAKGQRFFAAKDLFIRKPESIQIADMVHTHKSLFLHALKIKSPSLITLLMTSLLVVLEVDYGTSFLLQILSRKELTQIIYGKRSYGLRYYLYHFGSGSLLNVLKKLEPTQRVRKEILFFSRTWKISELLADKNFIEYLYLYGILNQESKKNISHFRVHIENKLKTIFDIHADPIQFLSIISLLGTFESPKPSREIEVILGEIEGKERDIDSFSMQIEINYDNFPIILKTYDGIYSSIEELKWITKNILLCKSYSIASDLYRGLDEINENLTRLASKYSRLKDELADRLASYLDANTINVIDHIPLSYLAAFVEVLVIAFRKQVSDERRLSIIEIKTLRQGSGLLYNTICKLCRESVEENIPKNLEILQDIFTVIPSMAKDRRILANEELSSNLLINKAYKGLLEFLIAAGFITSMKTFSLEIRKADKSYLDGFLLMFRALLDKGYNSYKVQLSSAAYELMERVLSLTLSFKDKKANRRFALLLFDNRGALHKTEIDKILKRARENNCHSICRYYNYVVWEDHFETRVLPLYSESINLQQRLIAWIQQPFSKKHFIKPIEFATKAFLRNPFFETEWSKKSILQNWIKEFKKLTNGLLIDYSIKRNMDEKASYRFCQTLFATLMKGLFVKDVFFRTKALWVLQHFVSTDPLARTLLSLKKVTQKKYVNILSRLTNFQIKESLTIENTLDTHAKIVFKPLVKQQIAAPKTKENEGVKKALIAWGDQDVTMLAKRAKRMGISFSYFSELGDVPYVFLDDKRVIQTEEIYADFPYAQERGLMVTRSVCDFKSYDVVKAKNLVGDTFFFINENTLMQAYTSALEKQHFKSFEYQKLLIEKLHMIKDLGLFTPDSLSCNRHLIREASRQGEREEMIKQRIGAIEVVCDILYQEFDKALYIFRSQIGISQNHLRKRLSYYLNALPGGTFLLHSHKESIAVLNSALNTFYLTDEERVFLDNCLKNAEQEERCEGQILEACAEELENCQFNVIRVPGIYTSIGIRINYVEGYFGAGEFQCRKFHVPAEEILMDAFHLYLKKLCGIDKVCFLDDKQLLDSQLIYTS